MTEQNKDQDKQELKPCPFCGIRPSIQTTKLPEWNDGKGNKTIADTTTIECMHCPMKIQVFRSSFIGASCSNAIARWNTRPEPEGASQEGGDIDGSLELLIELTCQELNYARGGYDKQFEMVQEDISNLKDKIKDQLTQAQERIKELEKELHEAQKEIKSLKKELKRMYYQDASEE